MQRPKWPGLAVAVLVAALMSACGSIPGSSGGTSGSAGGIGSTGAASVTTTAIRPANCDPATLANLSTTDVQSSRKVVVTGDGCWPAGQSLWLVTYNGNYHEAVKVERSYQNGWTARVTVFSGMQFVFLSGGDKCAMSVKSLTDAKSRYSQTVKDCRSVLHTSPGDASNVCDPDPTVEVPTLDSPTKSDDGKSWRLTGYFCPREGQVTWAVSVTGSGNSTVYNYYKYLHDNPVDTDPLGRLTKWTAVVPNVPGSGDRSSVRLLTGTGCDAALRGGGQRQDGGYYSAAKTAVDTACTVIVKPVAPTVPFPSNHG